MDRKNVILILQEHAPELKAAGLTHLRLFGSVARNQANADSDVDLLADFSPSTRISLVTLASLQNRLSSILGAHVELSSAAWMREPIREQALREAVLAF